MMLTYRGGSHLPAGIPGESMWVFVEHCDFRVGVYGVLWNFMTFYVGVYGIHMKLYDGFY